MCYDDETCTTTCPATGRKRRDAETALGIFRRDTDEVEYQENGLPGKNANLRAKMLFMVWSMTYGPYGMDYMLCYFHHFIYFTLVTNTLSAQILVPNAQIPQPSPPVTDSQKLEKIAGNLQKNFGSIQAALKKSKNQVRNLKKMFGQ